MAKKLKKTKEEEFLDKGTLTEKDAEILGHKLKAEIRKRFK